MKIQSLKVRKIPVSIAVVIKRNRKVGFAKTIVGILTIPASYIEYFYKFSFPSDFNFILNKMTAWKYSSLRTKLHWVKVLSLTLKQENYLCEIATNFNTAIEKVDSYDYDCILLDISLPDGNGLSILKILKENNKTDGVIIISAKDSIDDKIAGLTLGADDYIPKPFHLSELSARIAAVIRRRRFNGGNILVFHEITIDTIG